MATSDVQVIHGEDRVTEMARMLGDTEGDAARRHAQALLRTPASGARRQLDRRHQNPKYSLSVALTRWVSGTRPFFARTTRS